MPIDAIDCSTVRAEAIPPRRDVVFRDLGEQHWRDSESGSSAQPVHRLNLTVLGPLDAGQVSFGPVPECPERVRVAGINGSEMSPNMKMRLAAVRRVSAAASASVLIWVQGALSLKYSLPTLHIARSVAVALRSSIRSR